VSALRLLQSALSSPYPPTSPSSSPLSFNLEVIDSKPPTFDQLSTILAYTSPSPSQSPSLSIFLSAHPTAPSPSSQPNTAREIVQLGTENPNVLKWPIVVDWTGGRASIGDVEGVKAILEAIRKERDGEAKGDEEHNPKGWFS
jgi:hypothetical protein